MQLYSLVVHRCGILHDGRQPSGIRDRNSIQHIFPLTDKIVHLTTDTVQETEFKADIEIGIFLPMQIPIACRAMNDASKIMIGIWLEEILPCIVIGISIFIKDIIIPLHSVRHFQLQVVHPFGIFHKGFLRNSPGCTHRPEVTPTAVFIETRTTVPAIRT